MAVTTYGTSVLYGDGSYGRVSAELLAAQEAQTRETGLRVTVTDENLNQWSQFGNYDYDLTGYWYGYSGPSTDKSYAYYRGRWGVVQLDNGNIIRVRIGTPTDKSDRQIYYQTITDPSIASQWDNWTLLYSGSHLAVGIVATGASTYDIYNSRYDNPESIYRNNSTIVWTEPNNSFCFGIWFLDSGRSGKVAVVDVIDVHPDGHRIIEHYLAGDMDTSGSYKYDPMNYQWIRQQSILVTDDSENILKVSSMGVYNDPRNSRHGDSLVTCKYSDSSFTANERPITMPRILRGLATDWGQNEINGPSIVKLSDGYWYLFYSEFSEDESGAFIISNLYSPLVWQRSKDLLHWSEPLHTGVVSVYSPQVYEYSGYAYLVSNNQVWRRPTTVNTIDLSDYVPEVSMEIPKQNQPGSGTLKISNPDGVNDAVLGLSDRRVSIELGIKTATGQFEYAAVNDWWLGPVSREINGRVNRLSAVLGDVWNRLDNSLRDTYNFIGRTNWSDWSAGGRNESFNYYFDSDTAPSVSGNGLNTIGLVLWTGWKGHNPRFTVHLSGSTTQEVYFRWQDANNYWKVSIVGTSLSLIECWNGTQYTLASGSVTSSSSHTIIVDAFFISLKVWVDGSLKFDAAYDHPHYVGRGYVGFSCGESYIISNFQFYDWEEDLDFADVIKTALAMGDYHDVIVGNADAKAYGIIWGPQTDVPTAADGLRNALETNKLELIWKEGFIQVGRFSNTTPIKTIEDRIVQTEHTEETNRRINMAIVDGNENSWIDIDFDDSHDRDRQIIGYYDLPELLDLNSVQERAQEELRRGKLGSAPGGDVIFFFDLSRMDVVTWVDNAGNSQNVRIEGMSVEVSQGEKPRQSQSLDTSLV